MFAIENLIDLVSYSHEMLPASMVKFLRVSGIYSFPRISAFTLVYICQNSTTLDNESLRIIHGGREFFHSKGTWECAALKGIHFRTASLAKGILFRSFGPATVYPRVSHLTVLV